MSELSRVRLIGVTQPTGEHKTPEDLIAYVARVSNPKNQDNKKTAKKLLRYLAQNAHWSPFEMVNVVLEIETPRDIARQILRHTSFRFQEFSQRYADPTEALGFVVREARLQDDKNRQNSIVIHDEDLQTEFEERQLAAISRAQTNYAWARSRGIAREVARVFLPEGLTQSRMYMNGTLRSWIHYCDLRTGNGTQLEHQDVARKCWDEIVKIFPALIDILAKQEEE